MGEIEVHRCKEFEEPPSLVSYTIHLNACKDFLLVIADNGETNAFRHEFAWLYDLSTGIWQVIPPITLDENLFPVDPMFELQWDAVP